MDSFSSSSSSSLFSFSYKTRNASSLHSIPTFDTLWWRLLCAHTSVRESLERTVNVLKNLRLQHSGKARKGDGNDLTPNPRKLHNIGKELDKLGRVINDMKPVSELPFNARPKTRKEKNKLASRACRLKKKAQHEANKIKLYGLETEHSAYTRTIVANKLVYYYVLDELYEIVTNLVLLLSTERLMNGILHLKQILVTKCSNAGTASENPEEYKQQLDTLVQTSSSKCLNC